MLTSCVILAVASFATNADQAVDAIPLSILYIGGEETPRAKAYAAFLKEHFTSVRVADRDSFDPATLGDVDVALLDWSQSDVDLMEQKKIKSPLGPRENWTTPTVLLGSAGLLIAGPWQTNGSYGCTCLDPYAYNPREHEVFKTPISIDRSRTMKRRAPNDDWRKELGVDRVDVLPMVNDHEKKHQAGWCTYEKTIIEGPEVEFICGGINDKIPSAVGVWRQGHLLHFGFDLSPTDMSEIGKGMLINSIVYIARFTEDRPIVYAPSPFVDISTRPRSSIKNWLKTEYPLDVFEGTVDKAVLQSVPNRTREGYLSWFDENSRFLRPGPEGLLIWDEEAKALDLAYDKPEFFERAIQALRNDETRATASTLLTRYVPDGPKGADAEAWTKWHRDNEPYLFYSEWGSYRWYVDPLAQKRGRASRELRGPLRADR